ncbi:thiaminase II [Butyricicoccus sp.]|uniref:thiaminase II n=1 Tax=Butyricicoccus sp. TaxID=2049021 RepID=UPI002EA9AFE2|nr:thiaminase II [Butyricicoccus sp.]
MKVSERLYNSIIDLWDKYNEHPFVKGLADGTLPLEKFQFFMIQDHLYLMQYAKVFALGVLKAKNESDMRLFSSLIAATLDTENALHQDYLRRLNISQEMIAQAKPSIVTDSYTNYMIAIAEKEGLGELMAAVLSCSWSYKLIGDFMEKFPGATEQEFYGEWVNMYISDGYRSSNQLMIDMVDRLTEGYTEQQIQNLEHIVYVCSQYEYMFWDMAWNEKMVEV